MLAAMARQRSTEWLAVWLVLAAVVFAILLVWVIIAESTLAWIVLFVGTGVLIALIAGRLLQDKRNARAALPTAKAPDDGFYRVLVVVDDGATSPVFRNRLVESAGGRPAKAFVVAPSLASGLDRWTGDQAAYDNAAAKLDATLQGLKALGVDAAGRIGSHDPLQATIDGLREFPADEVIVATHDTGEEIRLEADFVDSVRGLTSAPVTHVVVEGERSPDA
jgi:hypothetical protein